MSKLDLSKTAVEDIPNTFLPRCRNKVLSINALIYALMKNFYKEEDLPADIRVKVRAEMNRRWDYVKKNNLKQFPL